ALNWELWRAPTQLLAKPYHYESTNFHESLPDRDDPTRFASSSRRTGDVRRFERTGAAAHEHTERTLALQSRDAGLAGWCFRRYRVAWHHFGCGCRFRSNY